MKHIEVEQKFRLQNHQELQQKLAGSGAKKIRTQHQVDVYYNAPHRDFLADGNISEWLRLRDEDGAISLNYKLWKPLEAAVKTHCDEYESTLGDGDAVRKLLTALNFTELITVDKQREEWQLDDIEIALDTVKDLGNFVEFEYKGDADSVAKAHEQITTCITTLGAKLGETHTGYPYQLIVKLKQK